MLHAMRMLERHLGQKETPAVAEEENEFVAHIEDELADAEAYIKMWQKSGDPEVREISAQKLKHADYWIRKARESGDVPEEQLQDAITWRGALLAKLA